MTRDAESNFLSRWSKRKHAARRGEAPAAPAPAEPRPAEAAMPPAPPPEAAPAAPAALPPIDSLKGLESDYEAFLRPEVDPATKSAALRKLFSDAHFNQMDGLDVYIDDYTKEDPIPATMLRALNQARALGLFDDEDEKAKTQAQGESAAAAAPAAAIGHAQPAATDAGHLADAAPLRPGEPDSV